MSRPWVVGASTYIDPEIEPDLLVLAERGLEFSDLRGLTVRADARAGLKQWHRVVWQRFGSDGSDEPGLSEPEECNLVGVTQLATIAGLSTSYVRGQCRDGALRSCSRKVGRRFVIERDAAERWLDSRKATP